MTVFEVFRISNTDDRKIFTDTNKYKLLTAKLNTKIEFHLMMTAYDIPSKEIIFR